MSDPNLNRRDFLKRAGFCAAAFTAIPLGCSQRYAIAAKKPNVLFIAVDDLRPELNCYGQSQIISPNIDRLVSEGTVFNRAYCNVPTCGASRASLLTGLRPRWPDRFRGNGRGDKQVPDALTMPMHFKNNGYHAISNGKIFHNQFDFADSWSEEPWRMFDYEDGRNWVVDNFDKLYLNPESANNVAPCIRLGCAKICSNSIAMRSALMSEILFACVCIDCHVAGSISKSSLTANRTPRSIRR